MRRSVRPQSTQLEKFDHLAGLQEGSRSQIWVNNTYRPRADIVT